MFWFALASLTPALCLMLACLFGGAWPAVSVFVITVFVFFMDRLVSRLMPDTKGQNGLPLNIGLALAHFVLWVLGIWALAGDSLGLVDKLLLGTGLGLYFGQISNSNAHELIHNARRWPRRLGAAIYCSILFGHHVSAHLRVHHVYGATARDPNTARLGEGFWTYLLRAWSQGLRAGKLAEDALRARAAQRPFSHPYLAYAAAALVAVTAAAAIGGVKGIIVLLVLSTYAQTQLYLSDYVQHYGLLRRAGTDGKTEPMGHAHSWNAPHWYSGAMMLNAPRHSAHHAKPGTAFPDLDLAPDMPTLPHSLPVMAVLALVPPIWRRLMDHRARRWASDPLPMAAE